MSMVSATKVFMRTRVSTLTSSQSSSGFNTKTKSSPSPTRVEFFLTPLEFPLETPFRFEPDAALTESIAVPSTPMRSPMGPSRPRHRPASNGAGSASDALSDDTDTLGPVRAAAPGTGLCFGW